jgi:hypothetical protein
MVIRLKEHHNRVKLPGSDDFASPIGQHARTTNHHFRPENITYLANEGDKTRRGILEAIYTRALDPPLNRGGGLRHNLTHTYDTILKTTIRPPKLPPPSAPTSLPLVQHKQTETCGPTCWCPKPLSVPASG